MKTRPQIAKGERTYLVPHVVEADVACITNESTRGGGVPPSVHDPRLYHAVGNDQKDSPNRLGFGDDDPMMEINHHQQERKYGSMRQGERELPGTFKNRFDEQVEANRAVGMAEVSESKRALGLLGKLDPRR